MSSAFSAGKTVKRAKKPKRLKLGLSKEQVAHINRRCAGDGSMNWRQQIAAGCKHDIANRLRVCAPLTPTELSEMREQISAPMNPEPLPEPHIHD